MNGWALMNGLNLLELDAMDMLDVLHYMFETDYTPASEESARARSNIRETIYPNLYNTKYQYALPKNNRANGNYAGGLMTGANDLDLDVEEEPLPEPFSPRKREVKPFIEATRVSPDSPMPFGAAIDSPLK